MYVYLATSQGYAVGHYNPGGQFIVEQSYEQAWKAAERVNFLNGGAASSSSGAVEDAASNISRSVDNLTKDFDGLTRSVQELRGQLAVIAENIQYINS